MLIELSPSLRASGSSRLDALWPDRVARDSFLESICAVAIVVVVVGIAMASYVPVLRKAQVSEAANLLVVSKVDAVVDSAVRGRLPTRLQNSDEDLEGKYVADGAWQNGEFVFVMRDVAGRSASEATSTLSFRVAREPTSGAFIFLCGSSEPPQGFAVADAADQTSIPDRFLPNFCRR